MALSAQNRKSLIYPSANRLLAIYTRSRITFTDAGWSSKTLRLRRLPIAQAGPGVNMLDERQLSALTSIGFAGTMAVAAAGLLHINCFANFQPTDAVAIATAIKIHLLVYALEGLVLLPRFMESDSDRAPAAAGEASLGIRSTKAEECAAKAPSEVTERDAAPSTDAAGEEDQLHTRRRTFIPPALVQAVLDIVQPQDSSAPEPDALQKLSTSLALYQLNYLDNAGAAGPQAFSALEVELPLIALRELSKEVLQRGLLLTCLAQWLLDRAYDAGAGDVTVLPSISNGPIPTTLLASYAAAVMVTAFFIPAALRQATGASMGVSLTMGAVYMLSKEFKQIESSSIKEYKALEAYEIAAKSFPVAAAAQISAIRNLAALISSNASYVVTGNLAASYIAALVGNVVLIASSKRR